MNAIELLKKDHRTVESLFRQFEKLGEGRAREKKAMVQKIVQELSIHASIEEQILYPAARGAVKSKEDLVLESLEEHHVVKLVASELLSMNPSDERYDAKVTVLKENVQHHVEEEEKELFPALERQLGAQKLEDLGAALASAKKIVPTRPHPSAPDEPPGNILAGLPVAMLDRIRDLVTGPTARERQAVAASRPRRSMSASAMNRVGRTAKRAPSKVASAARKAGSKPTKKAGRSARSKSA